MNDLPLGQFFVLFQANDAQELLNVVAVPKEDGILMPDETRVVIQIVEDLDNYDLQLKTGFAE